MTTQEVLKQCTVEGLVVKLPGIPLDRKDYLDVKNKLELIGGKWKGGKTQGFVFEEDPTELLADVANGDDRNLKKEFQFFATPAELADLMVSKITLEPWMRILEPSAGDGALIKALRRAGYEGYIDCYEAMDLNIKKLNSVTGAVLQGDDFLKCNVDNHYDLVLANPPFTKNADIDHIRKMFEVCKPGGTIVTLASPSWTFGSQKKQLEFKEWLKELGATTEGVAEGAFKSSGTTIRTVMIVIKKPAAAVVEKVNAVETPQQYFIRDWKNFKLFDGGPYLETGQNKLDIVSQADQSVEHTVYFDRSDPSDLNKAIERAKEWINQNFPDEEKSPADKKVKKVQTCRVCGCTQDDCRQCIQKTGHPCHWVEKDLCSACQVIREPLDILEDLEKTNAEIAKGTSRLKQMLSPINDTDMNFFQQLIATGDVDMTMRMMSKDGKITINIMPGSNKSIIKPIIVTGTGQELDEEFFKMIVPEVKEITGIVTNLEAVKKEVKDEADKKVAEKKEKADKVKNNSKSSSKKDTTKKKTDPKAAKKKEEKPVEQEASLFDAPEKEEVAAVTES